MKGGWVQVGAERSTDRSGGCRVKGCWWGAGRNTDRSGGRIAGRGGEEQGQSGGR